MREYPAHPLPGVLAAVLEDGKVLVVLRAREPDKGKWGLPGGLIEVGETAAEAALRELKEETGLDAEAGPILDVFDVVTRDGDGRVRYHFLLVVVVCLRPVGTAVAGDDAAEIGWFTPEELTALPTSRHLARLVALATATRFPDCPA